MPGAAGRGIVLGAGQHADLAGLRRVGDVDQARRPVGAGRRVALVGQQQEVERVPLRRVAEPVDQARVICFLASSDADFVTGITIDVTGGS